MKIDQTHIREAFLAYADNYDLNDEKIRLKVDHTFRVADLSKEIAESLSMEENDIDLAYLIGILHDIGRFEQIRIYHTFVDSQSVNHAALSADLLFHEQLIDRFVDDHSEDRVIETAVRLHNVYELPSALSERERMFADLLRDADKIDILKVNCESGREAVFDVTEEALAADEISDEVMDDIFRHRNVNRTHVHTVADRYVSHIAFVFGLVYSKSKQLMMSQGYLEQLLAFRFTNKASAEKMNLINDEVHSFLAL